ncbi:MAG: hypothetical protein WCJ30_13925 [Deltaproteobacteria bacterium]
MKLIEGYLRELRRLSDLPLQEFTADPAHRQAAEGAALKAVQGAIIITMSVVHRNMRLAARDYREEIAERVERISKSTACSAARVSFGLAR